jgi:hypothetical protein
MSDDILKSYVPTSAQNLSKIANLWSIKLSRRRTEKICPCTYGLCLIQMSEVRAIGLGVGLYVQYRAEFEDHMPILVTRYSMTTSTLLLYLYSSWIWAGRYCRACPFYAICLVVVLVINKSLGLHSRAFLGTFYGAHSPAWVNNTR